MQITSDAIIAWAHRYAALAEEQAKTADPCRAQELQEIARICCRVSEYPAESFHEALQSFIFTHLAIHIEQYGWSISAGRFDQDLRCGVLTEDTDWELLLSLWMKFMENVYNGIGATLFQNLTIGGQDAQGNNPTAFLRSVASLNNVEHWAGGNTCNIKFSASSIQTENALENMGRLAETFMQLGGQELQINVVDNAVLLDAQEHPEQYQDLVVRVAGYSAYFTRLSRKVQNEVISRNTQEV